MDTADIPRGYPGGKEFKPTLLLKLAIGGLVGQWVVVSVGWLVRCSKVIGTQHTRNFFPARTNCCFLRWNGKE
jgi:hypothetical protein